MEGVATWHGRGRLHFTRSRPSTPFREREIILCRGGNGRGERVCVLRAEAEEVRECHTLAGCLAHNLIRKIIAFTSFHRDGEKGESSARTPRGHNRNGI